MILLKSIKIVGVLNVKMSCPNCGRFMEFRKNGNFGEVQRKCICKHCGLVVVVK